MAFAVELTKSEHPLKRHVRAPHLTILSKAIQRAVYGVGPKRIIVTMPPRHGKSETTSKWAPAWFLDQFPEARVILGSYEASFASTWGDKVRGLVAHYADRLHVKRPNNGSADQWATTQGGMMYTAGVGGGFTGKGAHLLIIDDPVKNGEQAASITYREKTWEWFKSTAYTRVEPGGVVLIVMTRWHHDDLAGRLITQQEEQIKARDAIIRENVLKVERGEEPDDVPEVEEWEVIKLKALAEEDDPLGRAPGEALWPKRYDRKALLKIKSVVGNAVWRSLFQQEPTADEGDIFNRSWFRYCTPHYDVEGNLLGVFLHKLNKAESGKPTDPAKPQFWPIEKLRIYQTVDPAASTKNSADWFVIGTFMVTPERQVIVWDIERDRIAGPYQAERLWQSFKRWGAICVGMEATAFQLTLFQTMVHEGLPAIPLKTDLDKRARATPAGIYMMNEKVFFRAQASWGDVFEKELLQFPNGEKDDQVDVLSYAVNAVIYDDVFARFINSLAEGPNDLLMKTPTFKDEGVGGPNSARGVKSLEKPTAQNQPKKTPFMYNGGDDDQDD